MSHIRGPQIEKLNSTNLLSAHRVSGSIANELVEDSLRLTHALFPLEPGAAIGLRKTYEARIAGRNRVDDFEALEFFVYTLHREQDHKVVGAAGIYRHIDSEPMTDAIVSALRNNPPESVSFLRSQVRDINEFIWGGRLCIEPSSALSPKVMPFIILHILSAAQAIIMSESLAPVLLAFTRRHENDRIKAFYENLGFENTGVSLSYEGEVQDVFCLDITPEAPVLRRLKALTKLVDC